MKKYFVYYTSDNKSSLCLGPYYVGQFEAVGGRKFYHSEEDMLKMRFSPTINKKIQSAKLGTHIKLHRLHRNGDLMVKCVNENDLIIINSLINDYSELEQLNARVIDLKKKLQKSSSKILQ